MNHVHADHAPKNGGWPFGPKDLAGWPGGRGRTIFPLHRRAKALAGASRHQTASLTGMAFRFQPPDFRRGGSHRESGSARQLRSGSRRR